MSVTDRDRKILMVVVPLVAVLGFWFLLLAPRREQAAKAGEELDEQEQRLERARQQEQSVDSAKAQFASDYRRLVRLGKAVPTTVDMPSLLVQLDSAARGTGIKFNKIAAGQRTSAGAGVAGAPNAAQQGQQNAQAGANKSSAASSSAQSGASTGAGSATDTQTSTTAKSGGVPVGGGASQQGGAQQAGGGSGASGLETVPLELSFSGSFFRLADFFHRLKRFVRVVNGGIRVHGRLLTVDSLTFGSSQEGFPGLSADIKATVYLTPKAQGATAGASAQGPPQTQPAESGGGSQSQPATTAPPAPAATAGP